MYIYIKTSGHSTIKKYSVEGSLIGAATFQSSSYPALVSFMRNVENTIGSTSIYIVSLDGFIIDLDLGYLQNEQAEDVAIFSEPTGNVLSEINTISTLV